MRGQIYVLKRPNGFCGIYVNGHQQKNLVSNFPLKDSAEYLFDRVMMEYKYQARENNCICDIIFCENAEDFEPSVTQIRTIKTRG